MSRISYHRLVAGELDNALEWYYQDAGGGDAGYDLVRRFNTYYASIISEIRERPKQWSTFHGDYRQRVFLGWPYSLIYYVTDAGEVRVVALAHGHKEPFYWKRRR